MIIDNFDIICVTPFPPEAYAPLVIHPYAVLPLPISFQRFQPVSRRNLECFDSDSSIDHIQFTQGDTFNAAELSGMAAMKQRCSFFI